MFITTYGKFFDRFLLAYLQFCSAHKANRQLVMAKILIEKIPDRKDDQFLSRMQEKTMNERKKVFEHLAKASGIVHVFISGMLLYTEHEQKTKAFNQVITKSYVCLEYIIPKCLSSVVFQKVKTLRISVMEMRIGRQTKPSKGDKIHSQDNDQFHKNENDSKMSFGNQLDIFYENCLQDSVENEVVYFFHAPLLTADDFLIFQTQYVELQYGSLSSSDRFNRRRYTHILAELASIDDEEEKYDWNLKLEQSKIEFEDTTEKRKDEHNSKLILSRRQDHRLYIGYRATIEFSFDNGKTKWSELPEIIKCMQDKLFWSTLWSPFSIIYKGVLFMNHNSRNISRKQLLKLLMNRSRTRCRNIPNKQ